MKKKGLIVATIVMVLVLAVSLTTATYAWFSNSGSAKVSSVAFSVKSSSDVKIGVAATNTYKASAGFADFYSEGTVFNPDGEGVSQGGVERTGTAAYGSWTGDNNDLGLNISLPFDTWSPEAAIFSASARTLPVADPKTTGSATLTTDGAAQNPALQFDPTAGYMIIANGNGNTIDTDTIGDAKLNEDYLHIAFGAVAGSVNVLGYGAWIYVDKMDEKPSVGILAGLHACYRINNGAWTDVDLYGAYTQDKAVSTMTAPSKPVLAFDGNNYTYTTDIVPAKGDAALWVPLGNATKSNDTITYCGTEAAHIVQFELVIYLDGTDSDTITTALKNNSASIKIQFLAVNGTQAADSNP